MEVHIPFPSPTSFLSHSPTVDHVPRPIAPHVKKTKKPPTTTMKQQDGGGEKKKMSKSRNGCQTCKKKRLKCDETKPYCTNCQKRQVECAGYNKDFKWKAQYEDGPLPNKPGNRGKKSAGSVPQAPKPSVPQRQPQKSPSIDSNATLSTDGGLQDALSAPIPDPGQNLPPNSFTDSFSLPTTTCVPHTVFPPNFQVSHGLFPSSSYDPLQGHHAPHLTSSIPPHPGSDPAEFQSHLEPISPRLQPQHILLPKTDLNQPPEPSKPRSMQASFSHQFTGLAMEMAVEEYDEEIPREPAIDGPQFDQLMNDGWSLEPPSPANSSTSTDLVMYMRPTLAATSREMLWARFFEKTCGILSVKDGNAENPWRTYILPLAQGVPALQYAIRSMSALHGSRDYLANPQEKHELLLSGVAHMQKSLHALLEEMKTGLRAQSVEAYLATALALGFSDSWDEHVKSGIKHMQGARALVNQAIAMHRAKIDAGILEDQATDRLKFLCNTYVYMDVLARLTSLEDTDHNVDHDHFEDIIATVNGPLSEVTEIDPLLGCAHSLFPLIGRVANLVQKVRKCKKQPGVNLKSYSNNLTLVSQATELKRDLQLWRVPDAINFERPFDPTIEVEHSIYTAEAYHWATLLFLYQAVPEVQSESAGELAKRILIFLANVPPWSRATIVQIFPLLAASCEVVTADNRHWVRQRWQAMVSRLEIRNVDKCLEIIEEVWSRRDVFENHKEELLRRRQHPRGALSNGAVAPLNGADNRKDLSFETNNTEATYNGFVGIASQVNGCIGPNARRRMTLDHAGRPVTLGAPGVEARMPQQPSLSRRPSDMPQIVMEQEYTVGDRLHWLGVMEDHGCEVLLG